MNIITVKPVNNDHTRDPKRVAAVDRWSLFRGLIKIMSNKSFKWGYKIVVAIDRWSLLGDGR
jgi:hypothetical protein